MIAASVLLTETRHGFGQIVFVFGAYVITYFLNKFIIRPNLLSSLHQAGGPKKSLFFRGENYDTMEEIDVEKRFLATTGSSTRVNLTRWFTRGLFGVLVFALYSAQKSGKLVTTAVGLLHLVIACTFIPMESLSHSLLPLGLNAVLIVFYLSYNTAPALMVALYFTALFIALGLYGFSFVSKQFSTKQNLNLRLKSSFKLLAIWAVMACILFVALPGESIKELIRGPVEKIESAVEEQIDKKVMPALQKAVDSQLPDFDQVTNQVEGNARQGAPPPMPAPSKQEVQALRNQMEQWKRNGDFKDLNLKLPDQFPAGTHGGEGSGSLHGGGNQNPFPNMSPEDAHREYQKIKKQFEQFTNSPSMRQEATAEQIQNFDDQLKALERVADQTPSGPDDAIPHQFDQSPLGKEAANRNFDDHNFEDTNLPMPKPEEIKALQDSILESMKQNGVDKLPESATAPVPDVAPPDVQKEFEKIKQDLQNFEKLNQQKQRRQAQTGQLNQMNKKLGKIEQTSNSVAAAKTAAKSPPPFEKPKEPPPPPKVELPDLDRWWPLIKLAGVLLMLWVIFMIVSPFLQKNDERKTQEKKLTKKDRAKLKAFLKHTQEVQYRDDRDEVIRKYHAFLEIMEFIKRPRHESQPAEDFGEFLKQDLRRNLQELDSLTWGFSDVLYGEQELDAQRMSTFRKSFNEMARSFLNIS